VDHRKAFNTGFHRIVCQFSHRDHESGVVRDPLIAFVMCNVKVKIKVSILLTGV